MLLDKADPGAEILADTNDDASWHHFHLSGRAAFSIHTPIIHRGNPTEGTRHGVVVYTEFTLRCSNMISVAFEFSHMEYPRWYVSTW